MLYHWATGTNSSISIEQEHHDRVQDVLSMEIKCYIWIYPWLHNKYDQNQLV